VGDGSQSRAAGEDLRGASSAPIWSRNFILLCLVNFLLFMSTQMLFPCIPLFLLTASLYGLISGSALFIGALIGLYLAVPRSISAIIMSFGSGVLVSALTFDLMERAFQTGSFYSVAIGFTVGTLLFVLGDYFIDRFGGHHRKRIHGKKHALKNSSLKEAQASSSGYAIFLGALLDGIPESLAIGVGLAAGQGMGLSMMIAVLLSNLPEGISGSQAMRNTGRSKLYVMAVWGVTIITSAGAAAIGFTTLGQSSHEKVAVTLALAAGAILAMIADTMIPEAFEEGGRFVALATALGFLLAFIVSHLAR